MIDFEESMISFAAVPDYSVPERDDNIRSFIEEIEALYPEMKIDTLIEIDM